MKKCLTALSAVLLAAMLMVSLVACGSDSSSTSNAIVGNWEVTAIEMGSSRISLADLEKQGLPASALEQAKTKMTFTEDGKVTIKGAGESGEGTYKVSGDTVELTVEGDTKTAKYNGSTIVLDLGSIQMVFEKK